MSLLKKEKAIYKFFTKPENWHVGLEVHEKVELVRQLLLRDFWGDVKNKIEEKIAEKEWHSHIDSKCTGRARLFITYDLWDDLFQFSFYSLDSRTYFALLYNKNSDTLNRISNKLLDGIVNALKKKRHKVSRDSNLLCWEYTGVNFSNPSSFDNIMPWKEKKDERKKLIEEYTDHIIKLKDDAKDIIDGAMAQIQ